MKVKCLVKEVEIVLDDCRVGSSTTIIVVEFMGMFTYVTVVGTLAMKIWNLFTQG
jgi:hypothetical protein